MLLQNVLSYVIKIKVEFISQIKQNEYLYIFIGILYIKLVTESVLEISSKKIWNLVYLFVGDGSDLNRKDSR